MTSKYGVNTDDEDNELYEIAKEVVEQRENRVTSKDIQFVFDIIEKEAPYDGISIKQLFYGCANTS